MIADFMKNDMEITTFV